MRVLTYTTLFPNSERPLQGLFIYQRMLSFQRRSGNDLQVIAPVPYFPKGLPWLRWKHFARIRRSEQFGDLVVHHPRYLLLPRMSMFVHGLLMFAGTFRLALRLHRRRPFDCIDAHFVYPDCFAAVLLGKCLNVPVISSARGSDINLYPSFKLIAPLIRWTLKNSTGLIAVSDSLRKVMIDLGAPPRRVRVIGNGIDPTRFSPMDQLEARGHLGLPEAGRIIVSVGALIPAKGFQFLIPAFVQAFRCVPGLSLYIIGEGESRRRLEGLIRECGGETVVHLAGSVPNEKLRLWYSAADVSCLVSSREGWPNVLQESMACGTPVVSTRVWGAPEIVVSSQLGLLVNQNVAEIAAALKSALATEWNRAAVAQHAATRTWQTVAAEVEDFLSNSVSDFAARANAAASNLTA